MYGTGGCSTGALMGVCKFNLEMQTGQALGQHKDMVSQVVFSQGAGECGSMCGRAVRC